MTLKKYKPYLKSITLPLAVGAVSAIFTMKGMPYYDMQKKPFFTPPDFLFPIVWTVLYILMGISAARIRKHTGCSWLSISSGVFYSSDCTSIFWHSSGCCF